MGTRVFPMGESFCHPPTPQIARYSIDGKAWFSKVAAVRQDRTFFAPAGMHDGRVNGRLDDMLDGKFDGVLDGGLDGVFDGMLDGGLDGGLDGMFDGELDGMLDGMFDGMFDGGLDPAEAWFSKSRCRSAGQDFFGRPRAQRRPPRGWAATYLLLRNKGAVHNGLVSTQVI